MVQLSRMVLTWIRRAAAVCAPTPSACRAASPDTVLLNGKVFTANQALTREEAVTADMRGSAFAEGQDREKGHLSPGAHADLAVLSADVFTVPPDQLPGVTSALTLVGGVTVFDGKALR